MMKRMQAEKCTGVLIKYNMSVYECVLLGCMYVYVYVYVYMCVRVCVFTLLPSVFGKASESSSWWSMSAEWEEEISHSRDANNHEMV